MTVSTDFQLPFRDSIVLRAFEMAPETTFNSLSGIPEKDKWLLDEQHKAFNSLSGILP